jgi:hypothetical protein
MNDTNGRQVNLAGLSESADCNACFVARCCGSLLAGVRAEKKTHVSTQRKGCSPSISPRLRQCGYIGLPAYVASKWGVRGLPKAAALQLARDTIRRGRRPRARCARRARRRRADPMSSRVSVRVRLAESPIEISSNVQFSILSADSPVRSSSGVAASSAFRHRRPGGSRWGTYPT